MNREDLFFILFPIVSIISTLLFMGALVSLGGEPKGVFYFNKILFWFFGIMITLYTLRINKTFKNLFTSDRKIYFGTLLLSLLFIFYISLFQQVIDQHVFFIDLFSISLPINIMLSGIISVILYRFVKYKFVKIPKTASKK